MKLKTKLPQALLLISMSLFFANKSNAEGNSITTSSDLNELKSMVFSTASIQYMFINTEDVKPESRKGLEADMGSFSNFNGSLSNFISSGILSKYNISQQNNKKQITFDELHSKHLQSKPVLGGLSPSNNGIQYNFKITDPDDGSSQNESGRVNFNQNKADINDNYIFLISYKRTQ